MTMEACPAPEGELPCQCSGDAVIKLQLQTGMTTSSYCVMYMVYRYKGIETGKLSAPAAADEDAETR